MSKGTYAYPELRLELQELIEEPTVKELYDDVRTGIKCLERTARSVHMVRLRIAPECSVDQKSPLKQNNIAHVAEVFPAANKELVELLGASMLKRTALLRYRHRPFMITQARGIYRVPDDKTLESLRVLKQTPAPKPDPVDLFIFWNHGDQPALPPPPPNAAGAKPFSCPYCGFEIAVREPTDWAHHVFEDVSPYVCFFPGCRVEERLTIPATTGPSISSSSTRSSSTR